MVTLPRDNGGALGYLCEEVYSVVMKKKKKTERKSSDVATSVEI